MGPALIVNFIAFWLLVAYAISQGDVFGIVLYLFGFLFMHQQIEDLE